MPRVANSRRVESLKKAEKPSAFTPTKAQAEEGTDGEAGAIR